MYYSKDKLTEISQYINATLQAERANYENLIKSLEDNAARVADNMAELDSSIAQINGVPEQVQPSADDSAFADDDNTDYNVYGKTEYSSDDSDDEDYDDEDDDEYDDEDEDEHAHHHHHHHHHGHDADEVFISWGEETHKKFTKAEIERILKALEDADAYGIVLRAKGYVANAEGEKWIHFDYVPGEPDIRDGGAMVTGRICVIGSKLNEEAVAKLFGVEKQ
mgnify:CR=1 FL=1